MESITKESEDRISQLPDCLLAHILSFLLLDEAVRTCTLSKRWQFIWTQILKIDFSKFSSNDKKIQPNQWWIPYQALSPSWGWGWFVKMLAMCNYLKTLNVGLSYGNFLPSDVDQWIHHAIKNKVKGITLDFYDPNESYSAEGNKCEESDELYEIPEEFYSYSSLTKLTLRKCVLAPQGILNWGYLIKLRVEKVDMSDSLMEKILSSCLVLEFLRLRECPGLNNLNIYSQNLTTLEISGYNNQIPNISAPHLRILLIDNWVLYYRTYCNHEEDDNEEEDNEVSDEEDNEESDEEFDEQIHKIQEDLYSYSSLTTLTIKECLFAPQGTISWRSLKRLYVEEVELSDSLMEKILSGCPVLELLHLKLCKNLRNLNIDSPSLTTLEIIGYNDQLPNISAPFLCILFIDNQGLHDEERRLKSDQSEHFMLKNLSSIVEVEMETWMNLSTTSESTMNRMKQILESLKSVKKLELSFKYLKVITGLEVEGWKFPLFIQLRCLKLTVRTDKMSNIPGILAIIRSAPNLEALEILMFSVKQDNSPDEDRVSFDNSNDMDLVASDHLKTVKFHLFHDRDLTNEYVLTLVSILLKSAKVLEEMTIKVEETKHNPLPPISTLLDQTNTLEGLLTSFPRTSIKAVTVPCSYMGIFSWRFVTP